MEKYRQSIGRKGENKAKNYLKRRGYQILETNYRTKAGELDLIAKEKDCLIFVEVKPEQQKNTEPLLRRFLFISNNIC